MFLLKRAFSFLAPLYYRVLIPFLRLLPIPSTILGPVKGSHGSFEAWVQGVEHWVRPLYEGESVEETPPALALPALPESFTEYQVHHVPSTFLAHIHGGRIATKQCEVIGPDDRVFDDFFLFSPVAREHNPAETLIRHWLPRLKEKSGTYATIINYRALSNYYHWMVDCLTRLWILDEAGIQDFKLVVPEKMTSFQIQSLHLLGYGPDRLAPFGNEHWKIEHLLVPSYTASPVHASIRACTWLKHKFLNTVSKSTSKFTAKKIYVSRAMATKRRLSNEDEVLRVLEPLGFECVQTEGLSVSEQIQLFNHADVVIAPHGAGLTNILFMNERGTVIELLNARRAKAHFLNLASAMKLKYACITNASDETASVNGREPDVDFSIPIEQLEQAISTLGIAS